MPDESQIPMLPPIDINAIKEMLDSFFFSMMNAPVELLKSGEALPNSLSNALKSEGNVIQFFNSTASDLVGKSGEIMVRPPSPPPQR